jgi:hypothetical protein
VHELITPRKLQRGSPHPIRHQKNIIEILSAQKAKAIDDMLNAIGNFGSVQISCRKFIIGNKTKSASKLSASLGRNANNILAVIFVYVAKFYYLITGKKYVLNRVVQLGFYLLQQDKFRHRPSPMFKS